MHRWFLSLPIVALSACASTTTPSPSTQAQAQTVPPPTRVAAPIAAIHHSQATCADDADGTRTCTLEVDGTLEEGDHVLEQDNSLYDRFDVSVASGGSIRVVMTSDVFDTFLILEGEQCVLDGPEDLLDGGCDNGRVALNDDDATLGGHGTNSKVAFEASIGGRFTVLANSYRVGQVGPYHLSIEVRSR